MPSESTEDQIRLTFEDTLTNQTKLRNWLEILARDKLTLKPTQRDSFIRTFNKATLTVGRPKLVVIKLPNGKKAPLGKLHYFAQKMTYITTKEVKIKYKGKNYKIPIEHLWLTLLEYLLNVFPYSLDLALRMSAERFRFQARPGSVDYFPSSRAYSES